MIFEEQIDKAIEGLFFDVNKEYNLPSSDIDPSDSFAVDVIKERLNSILCNYVLSNKIDGIKAAQI